MGTPGRRVRRDGSAASSGRARARGVRRRRGARRRRSPTPIAAPRPARPATLIARPRAARPDAPPSRARRRALAFQCVHRASTSEFGGRRRPLRIPRRSSAVVVVHCGSHVGGRRSSSSTADPTSEVGEGPRVRSTPRRSSTPVAAPENSRVAAPAELPRRRSPRAWERRGVASDATARRPRRGAPARGAFVDVGGRADADRRLRSPTSVTPRDVDRASARGAPRRPAKPRTEARLGAPMRSPRVHVGVRRSSSSAADPTSKFGGRRRPLRIRRRRSARVLASDRLRVGVRLPSPRRRTPASPRRRTPAPTLAARMGAPGRRVRRDGSAASSGRGGARGVRRRRGARRRRSPTPTAAPRPARPATFIARPRAARPDAPPSRARRRALAFQCVHRASTSEFGGRRRPLRIPRRSSAVVVVHCGSHVGGRRSSSSTADPTSEVGEGPRVRSTPRPRSTPVAAPENSRVAAPANSRADARRAHGSAGASRPTRRLGGLVGARPRAGRPSTSGGAPTSIADPITDADRRSLADVRYAPRR
jgi:hypothetical protein